MTNNINIGKEQGKERGKCISCGNRTRHKNNGGFWFCQKCEMPLEDKLTDKQKQIIDIVDKTGMTPRELRILLNQPKHNNISNRIYDHSKIGHVKIAIISDSHIGQEHFDEELMKYAAEVFKKEGVKDVYHVGDILEGMSGRDGQIYELKQIGFSQQINKATEIFKKYYGDFNIYGIIGNHDLWYKMKNNGGVSVGEELQHRLSNFKFLGENEADVKLGPNTIMKMFHPGDGTAYAISYKMQKLVESLESGRKPDIIVQGHYHKAMYAFQRNIHTLEAGTLCGQTGWMRGKKIPAHKGFWILDMDIGKRGITRFCPHFYPSYN